MDALARLLPKMAPQIDFPRALLRGCYMKAAAQIEFNGVPIDTQILGQLTYHWGKIQERLIEEVDKNYGIYEGRTFKSENFAVWLRMAQKLRSLMIYKYRRFDEPE